MVLRCISVTNLRGFHWQVKSKTIMWVELVYLGGNEGWGQYMGTLFRTP